MIALVIRGRLPWLPIVCVKYRFYTLSFCESLKKCDSKNWTFALTVKVVAYCKNPHTRKKEKEKKGSSYFEGQWFLIYSLRSQCHYWLASHNNSASFTQTAGDRSYQLATKSIARMFLVHHQIHLYDHFHATNPVKVYTQFWDTATVSLATSGWQAVCRPVELGLNALDLHVKKTQKANQLTSQGALSCTMCRRETSSGRKLYMLLS